MLRILRLQIWSNSTTTTVTVTATTVAVGQTRLRGLPPADGPISASTVTNCLNRTPSCALTSIRTRHDLYLPSQSALPLALFFAASSHLTRVAFNLVESPELDPHSRCKSENPPGRAWELGRWRNPFFSPESECFHPQRQRHFLPSLYSELLFS